MQFSLMADCFENVEATSKRLVMIEHLVELFSSASKDVIDKIVYLTQGKLAAEFANVELGIAEKLAVQAVVRAAGRSQKEIRGDLERTGDIGKTAEKFLAKGTQATLFRGSPLTVQEVHDTLNKIARESGVGSTDRKLNLLTGLLTSMTPKEAKYILRIVTGNLRLGIADMTVLDALAIAFGGGKEARSKLERAYNISSDLGEVARKVAEKGLQAISNFKVAPGNPIRPMLAERLGAPEEILEKLGGTCSAEFKYDGERVQAHKQDDQVVLYSRRLENITGQYPDAVELVKKHVKAKTAIIEAEIVAVDVDTEEMKPFQELMHRRRKYGVKEAMEEHPVSLFVFDVLYSDGADYTLKPYLTRHEKLKQMIEENVRIKTATSLIINKVEDMERFFERSVEKGCEGLICKSIAIESVYQAGARGWMWIKYKREYSSEMTDTNDLTIVGAFYGRGKRAGTYGAMLLAAYNSEKDTFETATKCGTGFTDEDLQKLPKMMKKYRIPHKHPRVESLIKADVWFEPAVVIEVLAAEITLSQVHTCGKNTFRKGSGFALRFPRFTGKYRLDKSAEDATTSHEIMEMYKSQLKKLNAN